MITVNMYYTCDTFDNEMQFSYTGNTKVGDFLQRTHVIESPDPKFNEDHPDNPKIFKNSMAHILCSGSFCVTQEWTDEDNISAEDLDAFETIIKSQINCEVVKDLENKKCIVNYTYDGTSNSWGEPAFCYLLKVGKARIEVTEENSDMVCVVRINKDDSAWNVREIDITARSTVAIDKPDCELCYTVFCKEAYLGDVKLDKWTTKKQTTDTVNVTNKNSYPLKIIQYYK